MSIVHFVSVLVTYEIASVSFYLVEAEELVPANDLLLEVYWQGSTRRWKMNGTILDFVVRGRDNSLIIMYYETNFPGNNVRELCLEVFLYRFLEEGKAIVKIAFCITQTI